MQNKNLWKKGVLLAGGGEVTALSPELKKSGPKSLIKQTLLFFTKYVQNWGTHTQQIWGGV